MAKKLVPRTVWWFVYKGVNHTKKEVYFGVSKNPLGRKDGSHCVGGTKALKHWDCAKDKIYWYTLTPKYKSQTKASEASHKLEKTYSHPKGFRVIQTAGI